MYNLIKTIVRLFAGQLYPYEGYNLSKDILGSKWWSRYLVRLGYEGSLGVVVLLGCGDYGKENDQDLHWRFSPFVWSLVFKVCKL